MLTLDVLDLKYDAALSLTFRNFTFGQKNCLCVAFSCILFILSTSNSRLLLFWKTVIFLFGVFFKNRKLVWHHWWGCSAASVSAGMKEFHWREFGNIQRFSKVRRPPAAALHHKSPLVGHFAQWKLICWSLGDDNDGESPPSLHGLTAVAEWALCSQKLEEVLCKSVFEELNVQFPP